MPQQSNLNHDQENYINKQQIKCLGGQNVIAYSWGKGEVAYWPVTVGVHVLVGRYVYGA